MSQRRRYIQRICLWVPRPYGTIRARADQLRERLNVQLDKPITRNRLLVDALDVGLRALTAHLNELEADGCWLQRSEDREGETTGTVSG